MNQAYSKNVLSNRSVPKYIVIPCDSAAIGPMSEIHEPASFTNFDIGIVSHPDFGVTQHDLDEMKRMVREMMNQPVSMVYKKFGLLDAEETRYFVNLSDK